MNSKINKKKHKRTTLSQFLLFKSIFPKFLCSAVSLLKVSREILLVSESVLLRQVFLEHVVPEALVVAQVTEKPVALLALVVLVAPQVKRARVDFRAPVAAVSGRTIFFWRFVFDSGII